MEEKIRKAAVVGIDTLGTQAAVLALCFDYEVSAYNTDEVLGAVSLDKAFSLHNP